MDTFETFDDFLKAFGEANSTEYYGETYPEYEELIFESGDIVDIDFCKYFVNKGSNSQNCLDSLFDCAMVYNRYITESPIIEMMEVFISEGANFDYIRKELFKAPSDTYTFEENVNSYKLKSLIIDIFHASIGDEYINSITDWNALDIKEWELYEDSGEHNSDIHYICMKYHSLYLLEI